MTLAELRALCDAATPGPWEPNMAYIGETRRNELPSGAWLACAPAASGRERALADAEFIAAARAALPELIERVLRLEVRSAKLEALAEALKTPGWGEFRAALAALEAP